MTGTIGSYRPLGEFTTAGGGQSRWTFAERHGREYFLKEFLSPKFPVEGAPGSESTKNRQRRSCKEFEAHHRGIQKALKPLSSTGGNLVVTLDFFRDGPRYYKVTEKVDVTNLTPTDIKGLPLGARLLPMLTVAHSLNVLHRAGLVHGDVKPPNILVKSLGEERFSTKLIDFDNAVLADAELPPPDRLVGDFAYHSPEIVRYVNEPSASARLTGKSDVFALGLVFSEWLTGSKPAFDPAARYAGVAVARGSRLTVGDTEPAAMGPLIESMLQEPPADRPSAGEVHHELRAMRPARPGRARSAKKDSSTRAEPKKSGGLRGTLLDKDGEAPGAGEATSALRGSLSAKRRK